MTENTRSKEEIEKCRDVKRWIESGCPRCDSDIYVFNTPAGLSYGDRVSCRAEPGVCNFSESLREYEARKEPDENQRRLSEYGIEAGEIQPLEVDTGTCEICQEQKVGYGLENRCSDCQNEAKYTHIAAAHAVFGVGATHFEFDKETPKPSVERAIRVFCSDCDGGKESQEGQYTPDVQTVRKGSNIDPSCSYCGSDAVVAVDVWRRGAGFIELWETALEGVEQ
jgi:hypothetical protein